MKIRILLYAIIFCCITEYTFGQITYFPTVESITEGFKIERVEINDKNTIITVIYTETRSNIVGPYICFPPLTLMMDDIKETGVAIQSIGGGEIGVQYRTSKNSNYRINLFFSPLDPGVEKISIICENKDQYGKSYKFNGIKINNPLKILKTSWTEISLKEYYQKNMKDSREGIYEKVTNTGIKYKLGLIKDGSGFKLIFLSSDNPDELLKEGNIKAELTSTASDNIFTTSWVMSNGRMEEGQFITFKDVFMELLYKDSSNDTFIKLFPTSKEQTPQNRQYTSSGTGFLICNEGYIVTNHHVVKDADKITVRGLNGDFNRSINAKVVIEDINNDLAIIKTDEFQSPTLSDPPYIISDKKAEPGNSIFCLGYPLRATMGEEVKVTDGIISSNSGFMGDITSYQISAPVQPGNSGGPLFDEKGNVVGVINAKHSGTENVSYAVKSFYLLNMISSAPNSIKLQQINKISTLSFPEKIKYLKKYTYIIETN